jgi:hypothetical protein
MPRTPLLRRIRTHGWLGSVGSHRRLVADRRRMHRWLHSVLAATFAVVVMASAFVALDLARPQPGATAPAVVPGVAPTPVAPYVRDCLLVGAAVNRPTTEGRVTASLGDFRQASAELGPLSIRRSFDRSLP